MASPGNDHERSDDSGREEFLSTHPDLLALGRRLRMEMDETLRAEQHAARVSARRRSTIRDRLLLAEDRGERLEIEVLGGVQMGGLVLAVGADHVVLARDGRHSWIALGHVVAVRIS